MQPFKEQHALIFLALVALCTNGHLEINLDFEISVTASLFELVIYLNR